MIGATCEWRERRALRLPWGERDECAGRYFDLLALGFATQAPPRAGSHQLKRRVRLRQAAAKNLLDDWLRWADQVLAFLDDLSIPFTNNLAERDLRMGTVQQKIAGTFAARQGLHLVASAVISLPRASRAIQYLLPPWLSLPDDPSLWLGIPE